MPFLRTTLATDWKPPTRLERWLRPVTANPCYLDRLHRVRSWLIEFDDAGLPGRAIGLDADGGIVLAGPGNGHYGYWLDTNLRLQDVPGEPVAEADFEVLWRAAGVVDS
ncbi:MAG: hypothetical protein ACTHOH_17375 [Lysobacteraceae bacterium]